METTPMPKVNTAAAIVRDLHIATIPSLMRSWAWQITSMITNWQGLARKLIARHEGW